MQQRRDEFNHILAVLDIQQIGNHAIAVRLTDALGQYVVQAFTLKVSGANNPPQISSTPLTRAAINQDYRYSVIAKDPENDSLRYSLGRRPEGMTLIGAEKS
jgi:hypothetical protein